MIGAKKYYIYRVDESGKKITLGSATKTTYTDTKAVVGQTYSYLVRAYGTNSNYNSVDSEEVVCTALCGQTVLHLTNASTGEPLVSWSSVSDAVGYEVYRAVEDGEFALIATKIGLTYTDGDTVVDTKYSYKVKAIAENPEFNGPESEVKSIYAACEAPVITVSLNGKKPMVAWERVDGAIAYEIYCSTKSTSGYKKIATVEEESYTDAKATKNKRYYYKVIAVSENAESIYSNPVFIKSK